MKMFLTASTEHLDTVADYYHMAPLHAAVSRGHSLTTSVLTSFGANVNALDSENMTPLHYAAKSGHFKCAKVRAPFPLVACPVALRRHEPRRGRPSTTSVRQVSSLDPLAALWADGSATTAMRPPGTAGAAGCRCAQAFA